MNNMSVKSKKSFKIALYSLLSILIFSFSLLLMPFEFFFISAIFVLIALRAMEKELKNFDRNTIQSAGRH